MAPREISIEGRPVGRDHPTFLVVDIGQAHDGKIDMAHSFVDAAAECGVDAVKFQTHIADAESTLDECLELPKEIGDKTPYDYWKRMEFTPEEWDGLARHARERSIVFLSTAFSPAAVDLLQRIGMPAWKIASGEVRSFDLIDVMCRAGGPVLLSTGMSALAEIEETVQRIRGNGASIALFQCTSQYPTTMEMVGLEVIDEYRRRFDCPAGLSDHSGTVFPGLAAMAIGADLLEVHMIMDHAVFAPDNCVSVTAEEIKLLSRARDAFAAMNVSSLNKDAMAGSLGDMRVTFGKSVAPARELAAGTELSGDMLLMKKPGNGIQASQLGRLIGCRLARDVRPDRLLRWEDVEGNG